MLTTTVSGLSAVFTGEAAQKSAWYEIDASGARVLGTSFKPPGIGSKVWAKMTEEQKLEAIAEHSASSGVGITGTTSVGASSGGNGARANDGGVILAGAAFVAKCSPLGAPRP